MPGRISRGVVSAFIGFVLLCLFLPAGPLFAHGVSWPTEWKVFPLEERVAALQDGEARRTSPVPANQLASVPGRLEVAGRVIEGTWMETAHITEHFGRPINLENVFLDLEEVFGEVALGNSAFIFLPIESERAQSVTLGLSADWWMQAWLNGEKILDTTGDGDGNFPIIPGNNPVKADLREGENVLAVRFISGRNSSHLAIGGPAQMAEWEIFFEELVGDRTPARDQAYWSARAEIDLSPADADLFRGEIAGVEPLPARQYLYDGGRVRGIENPRFDEPVRLLLSKSVYPAEDLHLDAVIWLTPEEEGADPEGVLELVMRTEDGTVLAHEEIEELSPTGQFFSMGFPRGVIGRAGQLEARWLSGGQELGSAVGEFIVSAPAQVARRGRIPLRVPNDTGAELENLPFTVGVPFPRGALLDEANARLVDGAGEEIPLQARVSGRWSRFGYVKWLLCDFTADLNGGPAEFYLEYGPEVRRRQRPEIAVENDGTGFPTVAAGRLFASADGLWFDLEDTGEYEQFLGPGALTGEFVEHEDGRRYAVAGDAEHEIEELGSEKVVVRRSGWYREEGGEGEFCNYVTRLVFHRDSPLVRVYHTWIFTGDSNRDRIREMGWRFPLAPGLGEGRFLSASEEGGAWHPGDWLVQWDHDSFDLSDGGARREFSGGRSPGVAAASGPGAAVYFGSNDFWQNFPSELNFEDGAFTFLNWPRHNREPYFERPVPFGEAYRHRYAHEGNLLDFRLPEEFGIVDGELGEIASRGSAGGRRLHELRYDPEDLETTNTQGIARTEEMYIYLSGGEKDNAGARLIRGLDDASLRVVADPAWVVASGAFGRIHHRDFENYPEDEHAYREICRAPGRWIDRLEVYGKWIFGDIPGWGFNLERQTTGLYRTYRKNHHGWPFRWLPFARSGDPEMFRSAERASRMMVDVGFRHYVDDEVGGAQGFRNKGLLPWSGDNYITGFAIEYIVDCDYLWDDYHLTGFRRARDVALLWSGLARDEAMQREIRRAERLSQSVLLSCLRSYQATYDPWLLVAMHAIGDMYIDTRDFHFDRWRPAGREFQEYTGCPELAEIYRQHYGPPRYKPHRPDRPGQLNLAHHHQRAGGTVMVRTMPNVFGWRATGDDYYLGRLAHDLDWARVSVYEGEPEYFRGINTSRPGSTGPGLYTGWYIQQFPLALGAFEEAGRRPEPIPTSFEVQGPQEGRPERGGLKEVLFQKAEGESVTLFLRVSGVEGEQSFSIEGPDGAEFLSGSWDAGEIHEPEIPAAAPPGVYTLRVGKVLLSLPVTPPGVPEVFRLKVPGHGRTKVPGWGNTSKSQYWFRVPEGVEEFRVDIPLRGSLRRVSIWNPDMERAWDENLYLADYEGPDPIQAVIGVKPEHAGGVWRLTTPGGHWDRIVLDPVIEPVFSVSREKWFDPGVMEDE